MAAQKFTDDELIGAFQELKSPTLIAKKFNCDVRQVYLRRRNIEAKLGVELKAGGIRSTIHEQLDNHPSVKQLEIKDGVVLIGSDAHYWPNIITTAHRGFVHFCDGLKPKVVIMNGDVCDFATISRFPPIAISRTICDRQSPGIPNSSWRRARRSAGQGRPFRDRFRSCSPGQVTPSWVGSWRASRARAAT